MQSPTARREAAEQGELMAAARPRLTDQTYLRTDQYKDSAKLGARAQLYRFNTNPHGWLKWVFDRFGLSPTSRVLELGCGPGHLWTANLDRIPDGWDVILSDLSPGMIREARVNLRSSRSWVGFEVIDVQSIPFADDSFDTVIANHMLYHVAELDRALSKIRRVLRPGGRLYASTGGRRHLEELRVLAETIDPSTDWSAASRFGLENGTTQLSAWFDQVTLHRYDNSLIVTESAPIVAYLESRRSADRVRSRRQELIDKIEHIIELEGAFHIQTDAGLFEAL